MEQSLITASYTLIVAIRQIKFQYFVWYTTIIISKLDVYLYRVMISNIISMIIAPKLGQSHWTISPNYCTIQDI